MFLLVSWKNSLNLLIKPNNAYLLFLVSFKAAIEALRLILPFIVSWFIVFFIAMVFLGYTSIAVLADPPLLFGWLYLLSLCFAVHPSLKRKTMNSFFSFYFMKLYFFSLILIFLFSAIILVMSLFFSLVFNFLFLRFLLGWTKCDALIVGDSIGQFIGSCLLLILGEFYRIFIFSLLDADGNWLGSIALALKRTAKVVFYNAPIWIILFIFAYFISSAISLFQHYLLTTVSETVSALFSICIRDMVYLPICVAVNNTIYVKRVYDEKELYV